MKKSLFIFLLNILTVMVYGQTTSEFHESLKPTFDACYNEERDVESLLLDSKVKKRIVANYSQQYYDKLLEICEKSYPAVLNSLEDLEEIGKKSYPVLYDSLENYFHAYAWKDEMFESKNKFVLRYYPSEDLIAINLTVDGLEIDKSGFSDYAGWDEHPRQLLPFITQKAEQGYATAQLILALYYAGGFDGVDTDNNKCFMWAQKSAAQGNSSAQFILGKCYELGLGTTKDRQKAVEWMTKAASQQNVIAMDCLAGYYAKGGNSTTRLRQSGGFIYDRSLSGHGRGIYTWKHILGWQICYPRQASGNAILHICR